MSGNQILPSLNHPLINQSSSEESITATVKSIAAKDELSLDFTDFHKSFSDLNQSDFFSDKIKLPKIFNQNRVRFIADLAALYLKYHNPHIHQKYQFSSPEQQKLFDDLEKTRLVILGSKQYHGIKINLQNIIEEEILEILEIWDIPALMLKKFLGILENIFVANFKENITNFIENLGQNISNQEIFANLCADFIEKIEDKIEETGDSSDHYKNSEQKSQNLEQIGEENQNNEKNDDKELENSPNLELETDNNLKNSSKNEEKSLSNSAANSFAFMAERKLEDIEFVEEYKIFTKQYDLIVKAPELAEKAELLKLRENLNLKIRDLSKISHKLKAKLKRKLLSKKIILNEYNKEEGFVDPKKLTRLIANSAKKDNYLQIKENHYQDTIISILLDNSGSMRGNPMIMSIMACEIIVQILEKFSIKTEILGFTTSRWHGGKSKKLWEISGTPKDPGRLSDLCHIIYKNSNQSFKNSRLNLALMLKEGILKENIDGEAIMWASKRLTSYPQNRKILMVISDGAPVDDSTIANNDKNILTNHLKRTIMMLEKKSAIELVAIGIGHDVGSFYKNSITIKNLEDLGDTMVDKICDLL